MKYIRFEAHTFSIRRKNDQKDLVLDQLENSEDVFDVMHEMLQDFSKRIYKAEGQKKVFQIDPSALKVQSKARILTGLIDSGDYGSVTNIKEIEGGKTVWKKQKEHSDVYPYYFLMYLPKGKFTGLLIFQRTGFLGVQRLFESVLFDSFYSRGYSIDISPFITNELLDKFLENGTVSEIVLRAYQLPSDKAEKMELRTLDRKAISVEFRLQAKGGFDRLVRRLNAFRKDPNTAFFDVPELNKLGFGKDSKLLIKSRTKNGTLRTIDLADTNKLRPYYDVHDKLVIDDRTNHATFESLDREAKSILEDFQE